MRSFLEANFPRYEQHEPRVPVWCLTPDLSGCIHRFFDTSPISPSGRYLAVFQLPQEKQPAAPGEMGTVYLVDLQTGKNRTLARTCGWETQLGANINWGGDDSELFFNDVDTQTWTPFAWKLNPLTGQRRRMEGTVYHASPDGRWLISANLKSMGRTQLGYGVCIPREKMPRNMGPVENDGFYLTDTSTGKTRLIASIHQILTHANPSIEIENPEKMEIYPFHCKFNPQGDRLMLSLRWFQATKEPRWNIFQYGASKVGFAWVTIKLDGSSLQCAAGPELWSRGGHHATWFPDGKKISANLNIDEKGMRFVQFCADGSRLTTIVDSVTGSGHPTVHPDGRHLLTDCYTWEEMAFNDGTVPLRWIDLKSGEETAIVRIQTKQPEEDTAMRVDPHPSWDRSWRFVTFNAFVDGTRRVFVADMQHLLHS